MRLSAPYGKRGNMMEQKREKWEALPQSCQINLSDLWVSDVRDRQFDMEMQNDTDGDDVCKRSRFYQSLIDTPVLKSENRLDIKIFRRQQLSSLRKMIFLNMTSKNGRPELVSLLQYMKYTT